MSTEATDQTGAGRRILTIPNALSLLRLLTVPVFMWLFLTDRENAAVIVYGAGAWTDFFDGYIARRTGQVTEIGKLLDPLSDRVYILALTIALIARGTLPWGLAAVVIARDVLVLGAFPLLESRGMPRIPVNWWGKWATGALFFGLTWLALSETTWGFAGIGDDIGIPFFVGGAVLYWIAGVFYARAAVVQVKARQNQGMT